MRGRWTAFITLGADLATRPAFCIGALTFFYVAVIAGLVLLYGRGDFSTPSFVYQEF